MTAPLFRQIHFDPNLENIYDGNSADNTYHSTLRILCEAFQIDTDGVDFRCQGAARRRGAAYQSPREKSRSTSSTTRT